jgi:ATP-dependent helicase HrpB
MIDEFATDSLPIYRHREIILDSIDHGNRMLLSAPTGSGKSTQVPQFLLDRIKEGQIIYVTQPRRVATRALAQRVSNERQSQLGHEIGYEVRFDRCISSATKIIYVTEGVLLRKLLADHTLKEAGAIILDEFHERTINVDLCLALIKKMQGGPRPDLTLVVSSATLNPKPLIKYLPDCAVITAEGRAFPVRIDYSTDGISTSVPIWQRICNHVARLVTEEPIGDILIFLPGAYEIRRTIESLQQHPASKGLKLFPLYGDLSAEAQDAALAPGHERKVIVSTNVAETSLTIAGVRLVIDSGLAKKAGHDTRRGINTLLTEKISRASAEQRAGRAGRTAPGVCLRLWSESDHARRDAEETPEIHRVDLSETILGLLAAGYDSESFQWFDQPSKNNVDRAESLLEILGAFSGTSRKITPLGQSLANLPAHPRHARVLIEGKENNCPRTAALAIALTQTRSILIGSPKDNFKNELIRPGELRSDFIPPIRAWELAAERNFDLGFCRSWGIHSGRAREVAKIRNQLIQGIGLQLGSPENWQPQDLARSILSGYPEQVARKTRAGSSLYALSGGGHGELRRGSETKGIEWLVTADLEEIATKGTARLIMGMSSEINENWLAELFPDRFEDNQETLFDAKKRSVETRQTRRFGQLICDERSLGEPDPSAAAALLAKEILAGRLKLKQWNADVEQWIERVNFIAAHCPETEIPVLDESGRMAICEQLCLGCTNYRQIKNKEVFSLVTDWLSSEQMGALSLLAPETYVLPNRRKPVRIKYKEGDATIAATIQDLYDLEDTPLIAGGKYVLLVQVLAPNRRPAQVTRDMRGFWSDSYPDIRKQLAGRYPKHEWR